MKLQRIELSGVGGITNLEVPFGDQMNILCGPNGIGKTTVLEAVAHCFAHGGTDLLKRNVRAETSSVRATVIHEGNASDVQISFDEFEPTMQTHIRGRTDLSKYVLALKTTRTFAYTRLDAIGRDVEKESHSLWEEAKRGVSLSDVKNWFVNRYLYSAHAGALTTAQIANFELAKRCFSALNPNFTFSRVNGSSNEIMVNTPQGEIYYEYLSSGFKSCLAIMFGIIKEVEYRFASSSTQAEEFAGVILIDELELHLHPEWQYKIASVLTEIFRSAQFIVTTHSPHVIQSAEPDQIIALESRDGEVVRRELPASGYGFKGWTLDEVLTDVMGMSDTRTEEFRQLMNLFGASIDGDDAASATELFSKLDAILHPANHVRKLLRIQLGAIAGEARD